MIDLVIYTITSHPIQYAIAVFCSYCLTRMIDDSHTTKNRYKRMMIENESLRPIEEPRETF